MNPTACHTVLKQKWIRVWSDGSTEVSYSIHLDQKKADAYVFAHATKTSGMSFLPEGTIERFNVNEELFRLLHSRDGIPLGNEQTVST